MQSIARLLVFILVASTSLVACSLFDLTPRGAPDDARRHRVAGRFGQRPAAGRGQRADRRLRAHSGLRLFGLQFVQRRVHVRAADRRDRVPGPGIHPDAVHRRGSERDRGAVHDGDDAGDPCFDRSGWASRPDGARRRDHPGRRRSPGVGRPRRAGAATRGRIWGSVRRSDGSRASRGNLRCVRKVRAPQRRVAGNSRPPRGEDQCHSDDAGPSGPE